MSRRSHATPFAIWYPSGEVRRGHGAVRQGAAESADRHRLGEVAEQAAHADRGRRLRPRLVLEQTSGAGQPGLGDLGPDGQGGFADRSGDLPAIKGRSSPGRCSWKTWVAPRKTWPETVARAVSAPVRHRAARSLRRSAASSSCRSRKGRAARITSRREHRMKWAEGRRRCRRISAHCGVAGRARPARRMTAPLASLASWFPLARKLDLFRWQSENCRKDTIV